MAGILFLFRQYGKRQRMVSNCWKLAGGARYTYHSTDHPSCTHCSSLEVPMPTQCLPGLSRDYSLGPWKGDNIMKEPFIRFITSPWVLLSILVIPGGIWLVNNLWVI